MKELDFDELDRAVNTLMSDVPKAESAQQRGDSDSETILTIPTTLVDRQDVPGPSPVTQTTMPRTISSAPPAARRGGRFMDVVHPSSDMKTAFNSSERPVSRQAAMISPIVTPEREDIAEAAAEAPEKLSSDTHSAWPDPLDMAGFSREPDTSIEIPPADVPSVPPSEKSTDSDPLTREDMPTTDAEPSFEEAPEELPLTTPFLADMKVEKRPLGTNSSDEPNHAPVTTASAPEADTPNAESQLPAMPEPSPIALPAELQTDVLSIESDTTPLDAQMPEADEVSASASVVAIEAVTADEVTASSGPTSIQQQYKEKPSTGDQTLGGIYDTESLHQPLGHPAKKKSGWMWVVWVLILLVLGAAGGAAAYLYLLK